MKTKNEILQGAIDCFFEEIAKQHPEVKTGDIMPLDLITFQNECLKVYNVWILNNSNFKTCDACGGSGFDAIEERRPCFTCDGLGKIEL